MREVIELDPLFVKIFASLLIAIIGALLGIVWRMRQAEIDRREKFQIALDDERGKQFALMVNHLKETVQHDISELKNEMMRLRDERHKNTTKISEIAGRCTLLEDDVKDLKWKDRQS